MSLFGPHHDHRWQDLGDYDYHPPRRFSYKSGWLASSLETERMIERFAYGYTLYHQRCTVCGKVEACEIEGRYVPTESATP